MQGNCIVIGASHAAAQLAPSLRQEGWEGRIIIIGDEPHAPYHRPPLSKTFLSGEKTLEQLLIRPLAAYDKIDAEFMLGRRVEKIDRAQKTVLLDNGETLDYEKLALCTGSRPRQIPLPGVDLKGVHYLRTVADIEGIRGDLDTSKGPAKVVIIGGGYIGLETAAALNKLGVEVTVLEMMDRILQRVTAPVISEFYHRVHSEAGVNIQTGIGVDAILGENQVHSVQCSNGETLDADVVIIGAGIVPNIELAEAAGLDIDNGIAVNAYAQTSDPDIVAAGDCSSYPHKLIGSRVRLESVPNATEQAKTAAASICGKQLDNHTHPWFWSDQYDIKLQIAGFNMGYDTVLVRGDESSRSFSVWYFKGDQLLAADCINQAKEFMQAKQLLAKGINPSPGHVRDTDFDLKSLLA
ncbi:NAD(P)/FAD-dependent oxidoreductase [Pseudoteredinibacter isoporae]|uniref:3-phenylpropionate/trans-cinnamate dioxygenase ferredoxin reductase subunit n=1 Tax=Pseudoteredinibacter isoporae TaxID=570281 RepID=A0A7X0MVR1_9GAMM|nr:FAD-dependent oxidoreductase [Pseudoteredinibacter isoporae]MBB6521673.1 3-phenylpropionate/trans-cinnamate dioxygenase ferredoxin reductase subunit [Pseudoteredinibacter isoporae]NHO87221.1 FAD-dependent oxidoreductase [Pseudoteredinibacter isoporae]NIB23147.1 FAD-dependent oxidoreductase [Pseudoteredinibacter isoporae]